MDGSAVLDPYVPNLATTWLREQPSALWREVEGSLAFVDISGFTKLTERLARKGKVGAEEMSDTSAPPSPRCSPRRARTGRAWSSGAATPSCCCSRAPDHARAGGSRGAPDAGDAAHGSGRLGTSVGRGHAADVGRGSTAATSTSSWSATRRSTASCSSAGRRQRHGGGRGRGRRRADRRSARDGGAAAAAAASAARWAPARLLRSAPVLDDRRGPAAADARGHRPRPTCCRRRSGRTCSPGPREPEHRHDRRRVRRSSPARTSCSTPRGAGGARRGARRRRAQRAGRRADARRHVLRDRHQPRRRQDHAHRRVRRAAPATTRSGCCARRGWSSTGSATLPLRIGVNRGPVFAGDFGPPFRRTYSVKGDAINLAARVMGKAAARPAARDPRRSSRARPRRFDDRAAAARSWSRASRSRSRRPASGLLASAPGGRGTRLAAGRARRRRCAVLRAALDDVPRRARARWSSWSASRASASPGWSQELLRRPPTSRVLRQRGARSTSRPRRTARSGALLREVLGLPRRRRPRTSRAAARRAAEAVHARPAAVAAPASACRSTSTCRRRARSTPSTSEFRKARLEEVTIELLAARCCRARPCSSFDDAHLMDDASADLLEQLVPRRRRAAVAGRASPGATATTGSGAERSRGGHAAARAARRRGGRGARRRRPGEAPLPPHELAAAITARAGGNPLFLRGLRRGGPRRRAVDALPDSVEALVTSQIDRLPPGERTVLRYASVLGLRVRRGRPARLLADGRVPAGRGALRRLSYFLEPEGHGRYGSEHAADPRRRVRGAALPATPASLHGRVGETLEPQRRPRGPGRAAVAALLPGGRDRTRRGTTHGSPASGPAAKYALRRGRGAARPRRRIRPRRCPTSPTDEVARVLERPG